MSNPSSGERCSVEVGTSTSGSLVAMTRWTGSNRFPATFELDRKTPETDRKVSFRQNPPLTEGVHGGNRKPETEGRKTPERADDQRHPFF